MADDPTKNLTIQKQINKALKDRQLTLEQQMLLLKQIEEFLGRQEKYIEKISQIEKDSERRRRAEIQIRQDSVRHLENEAKILSDIEDFEEAQEELHRKILELQGEKINIRNMEAKTVEESLEHLEREEELQERINELEEIKSKYSQDYYNLTIKQIKAEKDKIEILEEQQEIVDRMEGHAQSIGEFFGVRKRGGLFGDLSRAGDLGNLTETTTRLKKELGEVFTTGNMLASGLQKIGESTLFVAQQQEAARESFMKSSGAAFEYSEIANRVNMEQRSFGVDTQDAYNAMEAFYGQYARFNTLSQDTQDALVANAGLMQQLGVSAEQTAEFVSIGAYAFGQNEEQVMANQKALLGLLGPGMTAQKLFEDYGSSMQTLAVYGDRSNDVFTGMIARSKSLNVEMGTLMGIVGQFDTFEGAATAAGKLNQMLGGDYLNSVELLAATEEERIDLLKEGVAASGLAWEELNRFEKRAIATAAGIEDMTVAAKIFNGELDGFKTSTDAMFGEGMTQEQLQEQAQMAQSVMSDMQIIMESFAVSLQPLIKMIKSAIYVYADWDKTIREATEGYVGLGTILVGVFGILAGGKAVVSSILKVTKIWTAMTSANTAAKAAQSTALGVNTVATEVNEKATKSGGKTAAMSAKQFLGLGAAFLMMGAGIFLASYGLAELASAMSTLNNEALWPFVAVTGLVIAGFVGLAVATLTLGASAAATWPFLLALGGALLMMGAGVALVGLGFAEMFKAMASVPPESLDKWGILFAVMLPMIAVAPGIMILAGTLSALALSLAMVGGALGSLDTSALESTSSLMEEINKLSPDSVMQFDHTVKKVGSLVSIINDGELDKLEAVSSITNNAGPQAQQTSTTTSRPLVIELEGRVLKEFIIDVVDGQINLRKNN